MGCGGSRTRDLSAVMPGEMAAQTAQSNKLENQLANDLAEEMKITKCLLLGGSDCGKTTILRQIKLLYDKPWSEEELRSFIPLVRRNTLESMQVLCALACETLKIPFSSDDNRARAAAIAQQTKMEGFAFESKRSADMLKDVKLLWQTEPAIKTAFDRAHIHDFALLDSADYLLNAMDRIWADGYVPTVADVLRTRSDTSGIAQVDFNFFERRFRMYDVGGQRGERKKWIHYFANVSAIIWVASLSEFNQSLTEDPTRNRASESLKLFEALINLPWFREKALILLMNKADVFKLKLDRGLDVGTFFPKYTGRRSAYDDSLQFLQDLYLERARHKNHSRVVHCFVTDATTANAVDHAWKLSAKPIVESHIRAHGMH